MKCFYNLVAMAILISLMSSCAQQPASDMVTITGKYLIANTPKVELFKTVNGKKKFCASTQLASDGSFGFLLKPEEEGYYYLGYKKNKIRLYVKPKMALELKIEKGNYDLLGGVNVEENEELKKWEDAKLDFAQSSIGLHKSYTEVFPKVPKFEQDKNKFLKQINTSNPKFNKLLKFTVEVDYEKALVAFLYAPHTIQPRKSDLPAQYEALANNNTFGTCRLLELGEGQAYMVQKLMYKVLTDPRYTRAGFNKIAVDFIENDTLKGFFVVGNVLKAKKYGQEYLKMVEPFRKYLVTDYLKKRVADHERSIRSSDAGAEAIDFKYADINGKEYALSDFKGKVVLVDVWSTWCTPCKKEIPYLNKLEKELHGKDVVFISVSVDKDKKAWEKYLQEHEMGGIQLIGDKAFDSSITKNYNIHSIPRFLLFDKAGKILNSKADRPSNPALKEQILDALKK